MKNIIIKKTGKKGKGVFANKNFKKGELVMKVDLSKEKSYSRKEVDKNPKLQSEHCDYVGRGRYVISFHPYSYINHSCNPNLLIKHKTMAKSAIYAMGNIKKGEELTYDYGANALDSFDNPSWKSMKCNCSTKNCRKMIYSSFFKLPKYLQKKYYRNLPPSIKKRLKIA